MTPFLVCLATVLCLNPSSVLSHSNARECNEKCLHYHKLPDPTKDEVNIRQMNPVMRRQRREAQDDSTEHVSPRDDSDWSSSSTSSEDLGDIFAIWRKKRDSDWSSGSTSSEDLGDIFGNWRKKRDSDWSSGSTSSEDLGDIFAIWRKKRGSKRSPGSTSSEDVGDIFEIWKRGQDWSWEEGNSGKDVYGD